MPLQVVDRGEGQLARGGQRLARREAHQQRADEPRPLGGADQVDLVQRRAGLRQRPLDDRVDQLEVVSGGDLGDHAAEAVVGALGGDHVRSRPAVLVEDRGAGVVAAGLKRQDRHIAPGIRHIVQRTRQRRRRAPHHQRVLAVVLVVAATHPRGAEPFALVEVDRHGVGAAHLQREARLWVVDLLVELGQHRRGQALALVIEVDGDVHDVPDRVIARADQEPDQALAAACRKAHPRLLGELQHEHRKRPRGREHPPLDPDHLGQVRIAQAPDPDRRRGLGGRRGGRALAHAALPGSAPALSRASSASGRRP